MERRVHAGRLVFGDDLTAGADLAWMWINAQPWSGWELAVITADPPPLGHVVDPAEAVPHPVSGPPPRPTSDEPGFESVTFLEARLDPRLALCGEHGASLVVVGPANQGLGPWHLGSTTEWLLLDPPAPILVARTGRPVRRVLIAADGSPHAEAAVDAFLRLPLAGETDVVVVAVDDGTADVGAADALAQRVGEVVADVSVVRRRGRPHRELLAAVSSATDLVVLGTRGVGGLDRLRLGSTASAVARHAPCSVLVARAPVRPDGRR